MKFLNGINISYSAIRADIKKMVEKQLSKPQQLENKLKFEVSIKEFFPTIDIRPKVHFTVEAYKKMKYLVKNIDKEIAWHGVVEKDGDKYTITDILVYPQVVTGVTVDSTGDYPMWLAMQPEEIFPKIRMQGHSHVNMGVSPSGTDRGYMNEVLEQVNDYYIFIIFNKRDQIWIELVDIQNNCIFEKKDIDITYVADELDTWAAEQIDAMVTNAKTIPTVGKSAYNYQDDESWWAKQGRNW